MTYLVRVMIGDKPHYWAREGYPSLFAKRKKDAAHLPEVSADRVCRYLPSAMEAGKVPVRK